MNFIARVFRFVFWTLILSLGVRILRRVVSWMLRGGESQPQSQATGPDRVAANPMPANSDRRLVRDPVCGMHLAETLSTPLSVGSQTQHFCSTACRDAYLGSTRKLAANGEAKSGPAFSKQGSF